MSLSNSDNVKKKVRVEICSQLIDGRYLNDSDSYFLEIVAEDVQSFQQKTNQSSVLIFPPFNNYHRFLIHKLVEDNFEDLSTFSIGHSFGRRTVVCYKERIRRQEAVKKSTCVSSNISMGVQQRNNSNEEQESHAIVNGSGKKKARTIPDVAIYRPPALRKSNEGPSTSSCPERKPKISAKQRRPDIAVYVPRALRGTRSASTTASTLKPSAASQEPVPLNASENGSQENIVSTISNRSSTSKKDNPINIERKGGNDENLRVDGRPIAQENSGSSEFVVLDSLNVVSCKPETPKHAHQTSSSNPDKSSHDEVMFDSRDTNFSLSPPTSRTEPILKSSVKNNEGSIIVPLIDLTSDTSEEPNSTLIDSVRILSEAKCTGNDIKVEHIVASKLNCLEDGDNVLKSEKESPCAKNISIKNTGSCNIQEEIEIKTSPIGSVKLLDTSVEINASKMVSSQEGKSMTQQEDQKVVNIQRNFDKKQRISPPDIGHPNTKNFEFTQIPDFENDSEEDSVPLSSWEELFDLSEEDVEVKKVGESKKSTQTRKLLEEVVTAVGRVNVAEKPRADYTQYRTDGAYALAELSHVVEVYGFPAEFKTQDLISVLSCYGGGNSCTPAFEIKWVDDTHALAVFASSFVAADVLNLRHPMVKTRSLEDACSASKAKARKTCESLRIPFRPRPETCAALAQRLITGALGVHRRQTREERDEERRLLREAREKRRNAAKERDAAWEGTIGSTL